MKSVQLTSTITPERHQRAIIAAREPHDQRGTEVPALTVPAEDSAAAVLPSETTGVGTPEKDAADPTAEMAAETETDQPEEPRSPPKTSSL